MGMKAGGGKTRVYKRATVAGHGKQELVVGVS